MPDKKPKDPPAQLPASQPLTPPTRPLLKKSDLNLVWLDCEMTGLDPQTDRIIEIAVVVTGPDLEPRVEGSVLVIH